MVCSLLQMKLELVLSLMAYMFTAGVELMGYPRKKLQSSKGGKLKNSLAKGPRSEVVAVGQSQRSSAVLCLLVCYLSALCWS